MSEPTQNPPEGGQHPEREAQTAVAPLNTIAPEDIAASANAFDAWLRKISGDYVTLDRLTTVAGSLPVLGNVMALVDALVDVVRIVEGYLAKKGAQFLDWVSLGINLIGIIPGFGAARMSLRPALHLVKSRFAAGAKDIGAAVVEVLAMDLADKLSGEIETFVEGAMKRLKGMLDKCADLADGLADELSSVLRRCLGSEPLFKLNAPPPPPEPLPYDPKTTSIFGRMMQSARQMGRDARHAIQVGATHTVNAYKQAGNYVGAKAADLLPEDARARVQGVINSLQETKTSFRANLAKLADPGAERGIMWMLTRLLEAIRSRKRSRAAMLPADKGAQVRETRHGQRVDGTNKQAQAKADPNRCKACPAPAGTGRSISYVTGAESFTHTDFVLQAPIPIEWSRTYRSDLAAFDHEPLGARWLTPFTTRVDVQGKGRQRTLVYRGADGRSHGYPWIEAGQSHHDAIEERTLTRVSPTLLFIDTGKPLPEGEPSPWRETYELVDTCEGKIATHGEQHFRLVAIQALHGAAIGLRYDHEVNGEQVLSDILSKQGEQTLAHVGVKPNAHTGRIESLWEIKDGELVRQLAAYEHDDQGDLVLARDENGAAWHYQYRNHLVTRYTDRTGRGMNLAYDGTGSTAKAIHEWADDGSYDTRLEWDQNIRLTYVTDALGQETWVYYDILGYPYRIIHADKREEWFYRDEAKNLTCHVHPDGATEHFRYDEHGNLLQHTRADGTVLHFEYDPAHRLTGILDPDGGTWKRGYDPQGRLSEETDPLGNVTEYAYDEAGRVTKVTDAKGGVKKLAYAASGLLTRYTDCSGRTTQWSYDPRGRPVRMKDAAGNETRYRYTPLTQESLQRAWQPEDYGNHPGQLEAVVHPDETEEQFCHDAEGRLLKHTDALKRTTTYRYTAAGLVHDRVDAMGHRLGYRWDGLGRLVELRNENDQPYRFKYDPVGKLLQETGFDQKTTEYRYAEETGVLQAVTEGDVTTELKFDPMGRLLQRKARAPGRDEQVESFGYYPGGQIGEAKNEHARLQWFYDPAGNLVREHHTYQGPFFPEKKTAVWRHRYDELNQRIGTTRPDGHTVEWLTYGSGHVHGLVLDGADVLGFERDALHREVYRQQGNGLAQQQKYDALGLLLEQQVHPGLRGPASADGLYERGQALDTPASIVRRYSYDKAGQLDHIEDSRRGRLNYRYDPVGRLLQATTRLGQEVFAFDPAGNIVPAQDADERAVPVAERKLPKVLDNLLKAYAGTTYSYDERGNLTERVRFGQRTDFEWDAFNRMTKATTPEATATFAYDPLGRRIAKRSERPNPHGGEKLREDVLFGWDGDTLAFESRAPQGPHEAGEQTVHYLHEPGGFVPLLQARRSGAIELAPATDVTALMAANHGRYEAELDPLWNGELDDREVQPFEQQEIVYFQCDHLGTPQELTDHEGKVAWAAQYRAWGMAKEAISDAARKAGIANPIRFQGQYFDEETGLHYNRYRYYDPHAGRFVSKDPIGLLGLLNVYVYAPSTTAWVDPLGLNPRCRFDPNMSGLEKMAHAIHGEALKPGKSPRAFNSTTIAVAELQASDGRTELVAASSAGVMTPDQRRKALALGVRPLSVPNISGPEGHAERNIINRYAEQNDMKVADIAASRPICCSCHAAITQHGANPVSPVKGRKR